MENEKYAPPAKERPWRLAVLGLGSVFETSHAPALCRLREAGWPLDVVALCDVDAPRLNRASRIFSEAALYSDPVKLASAHGATLDGALVLTTPVHTPRICRILMSWGVPLFAEKPVAVTSEEIACLEADRTSAGGWVQVGYNRRFHPALGDLESILPSLGKLSFVRVGLGRRQRSEAGFYEDVSVHSVNLLQYLLPSLSFRGVQTFGEVGPHRIAALIKAEFESARLPLVELFMEPHCGRAYESIEFHGCTGTAQLDYLANGLSAPSGLTVWNDGRVTTTHRVMAQDALPIRLDAQGFVGQLTGFLTDSRRKTNPKCTLSHAIQTLTLVEQLMGGISDTRPGVCAGKRGSSPRRN